jgi:hypothetical protein
VLQKKLYNFERVYKFIQRTCTVFWNVITLQNTPSFTLDSYGSMWLPLVMRQTSHLQSISCHMLRSIFGVTSATAAVIRLWSSVTFTGKGGMNSWLLTNPHKK